MSAGAFGRTPAGVRAGRSRCGSANCCRATRRFRSGGRRIGSSRSDRSNSCESCWRPRGDEALPVTVLGGGSNVVVADEGVRGVVVRLHLTAIEQIAGHHGSRGSRRDDERPGPMDDRSRSGRTRSVGGDAGHRRRRDLRQRALRRARHRRPRVGRRSSRPETARWRRLPGRLGFALRHEPAAADRRDPGVGRTSTWRRAIRRNCERSRARRWRIVN